MRKLGPRLSPQFCLCLWMCLRMWLCLCQCAVFYVLRATGRRRCIGYLSLSLFRSLSENTRLSLQDWMWNHICDAHCNTLQHTTATHCNTQPSHLWWHRRHHLCLSTRLDVKSHLWCTLQHTATHYCNTLQHTGITSVMTQMSSPLSLYKTRCEISSVMRTATHCNTLLQHTATHNRHICDDTDVITSDKTRLGITFLIRNVHFWNAHFWFLIRNMFLIWNACLKATCSPGHIWGGFD